MTASGRRRNQGRRSRSDAELLWLLWGVGVAVATYVAWRGGLWLAGRSGVPANPVDAVLNGTGSWPIASTVLWVLFAIATFVVAVLVSKRRTQRAVLRHYNEMATYMAAPAELAAMTPKEVKRSAARLRPGADVSASEDWGLLLGQTVGAGKVPLYMTWEWVGIVLAGPRAGKTTAVATPMIVQAPGACFVTSNKPDIHDQTCWVRDAGNPDHVEIKGRGHRQPVRGTIWRYDLQDVATTDELAWWWNPLGGITELNEARELASIFKSASTDDSARVDAYFDGGAQELLSLYILAAAVGGGDLKHVHAWLGNKLLAVPAEVLSQNNCADAAAALTTVQGLNPKQKDGLYDMARRFVNVMTVPHFAKSVTPQRRTVFAKDNTSPAHEPTHSLPEFDPVAFVTSTDTLYALSMEGAGGATALTTALADAVFKAARKEAIANGGRLAVPLVAILDEAANICKMDHLPEWYSYFGSAGIVTVSFFQSWDQVKLVWNDKKLKILQTAANVTYFGGSNEDPDYHASLSKRIGMRDVRRYTRSSNGSGGAFSSDSQSESWSREPILDVDDIGALPPERAILITHNNRPVMIEKGFYSNTPYAAAIKASKDRAETDRATRRQAAAAAPGAPVSIRTVKEAVK